MSRGPNFMKEEIELLRHLVKEYPIVAHNNVTDTSSKHLKRDAWKKLTEEFNSLRSYYDRNVEQLQSLYRRLRRCRNTNSSEQTTSETIDESDGTEESKNNSSTEDDDMEELTWEEDPSAEQQIFILVEEKEDSNQDIPVEESLQHTDDLPIPAVKSTDRLELCGCNTANSTEQVPSQNMDESNGTEDNPSIEDDNMEKLIWEEDANEEQHKEEDSNQDHPVEDSLQHTKDLTMTAQKSADPLSELEKVTELTEWSKWLKRKECLKKPMKREKTSWKGKKKIRLKSNYKLLQSKLELVELVKKHTETEAQLKQRILKEQLRQENIKTAILQLKLNKTTIDL